MRAQIGGGTYALLACGVAALLAHASPARADDGAGAFRFGLGADVFDWHSQDWFHAGRTTTHREGFDLVLVTPRFELQLAGQVTPEIALGAVIGLGWGTQSQTDRAAESAVTYLVQALAEYAPWAGAVARPFARATIGVGGAERDHPDPTLAHYSVVLFELVGTLGVHLFPARSISISPYARAHYATGPGTETAVAASAVGVSTTYVALSVGLEVIGWIGGAVTEPAASPIPEAAPQPAAPTVAVPTFEDGVLEVHVPFAGGVRGGALSAEPRRDPNVVEVRLATPTTRTELEHCEAIEIIEGEARTSLPLSVERRTRRSRSRFVLRFQLAPSVLALWASRRAGLEACGQHFDFAPSAPRTVLGFLASLLALEAEPIVEAAPIPAAPIDAAPPPPASDAPEGGAAPLAPTADSVDAAPPISPSP